MPSAPAPTRRATPGKLTWSQRQELARKEREAEEAQEADAKTQLQPDASSVPPPPPPPPAPPAPAPSAVREEPTASAGSVDEVVSKMNQVSVSTAAPSPQPPQPKEPAASAPFQGQCATVLYDYDAEEDNEITLREGDVLTHVDQVDEGWWSATAPNGAVGLFPANYVELREAPESDSQQQPSPSAAEKTANEAELEPESEIPAPPPPPPPAPPAPEPEPEAAAPPPPPPAPPAPPMPPTPAASSAPQAIALYDYEIDEDNEIALAEGDRIVEIEFASEDWWSGTNERTGMIGLFPAVSNALDSMEHLSNRQNYVEIQE